MAMLAMATTSLGFAAPLAPLSTVTRGVSTVMQEKSQAIPFLKRPAALDGALLATSKLRPRCLARESRTLISVCRRDRSQSRVGP